MSVVILVQILFLLLHYPVDCSSSVICHPNESSALLQFKDTLTSHTNSYAYCGDKLPAIDTWVKDTDCCLWDGITCDGLTGDVIGLDLSCRPLGGKIAPNTTLLLLSHLQRLNLAYTYFDDSSIPSSGFSLWTNLTYLNLSTCGLSGQTPSDLHRLSKLVSLDLSGNDLEFDFNTNGLENILANLTELIDLDLSEVNMSLISSEAFLNLSSSLRTLRFSDCSLRGNFDGDFARFKSLELFDLSYNNDFVLNMTTANWPSSLRSLNLYATGSSGELLEHSIGNLKSMEYLDLSFNNLFGLIPTSLGNLESLEYLYLRNNNLSGSVPHTLGNLKQLKFLDLSSNHFSGQIPDIYADLRKLEFLYLFGNDFSGQLPPSMFKFTELYSLDISFNNLNGTIPSWLFALPSLNGLDLQNNNLNGPIKHFQNPHHSSLKYVRLSDNMIDGPIPISIFELTNLTELDLSSNKLSGIIEWSMLQKLKNLENLNLSNNSQLSLTSNTDISFNLTNLWKMTLSSCNITEFPYFLSTQQALTALDLSNNRIHGQFSKQKSEGWKSLQFLNLSGNFLTGLDQHPWQNIDTLDLNFNWLQGQLSVPPPSIRQFMVSNNRLSGEIPSFICNLGSIQVLDLSNNGFSGLIPKCLGIMMNWLVILDLRNNNFSGKIPEVFGNSGSLVYLNLHGNNFEGPLPPSLGNCSGLRILDFGNNNIRDTFPHWLEALPNLEILILRSNSFHGEVGDPSVDHPFPSLQILDLSHNHFTGFVPIKLMQNLKSVVYVDKDANLPEYVGDKLFVGRYQYFLVDAPLISLIIKGWGVELRKILTILTVVDCSSNEFRGEIPEEIGMLKSLVVLNFSHNSLTGRIPLSFANLTNMESLDLSSNKLVGEIPSQLTLLSFLAVLNLTFNQLKGQIPQGKQFNTFANDSYVGNLGLCGFPLSQKCSSGEPPQLSPSPIPHEEEDSQGWFDWKFALMGYGCGMVFGLSMGYIVLATRKPQWIVRIIEERQHRRVRRPYPRRTTRRRNH
ncbi:serine/threonine-protein kinase bri1, putative [Ricinus communis]|uniref:Serine/threonine-protein kinase bri1, putative n=1 Tax=Ricinus communis TaxID=3988 RepID=B9SGA2_RICCO|nr:serine/threonine-protein kinase bri1, putative [Ricinus communis]|eukprot:XP_002525021.1 receptor-like protein 7 [Ricinus communis]